MPVNFKVFNVSEDKFIDFAFLEFDHSGPCADGCFSSNGYALADRIIFLEPSVPIQHYLLPGGFTHKE